MIPVSVFCKQWNTMMRSGNPALRADVFAQAPRSGAIGDAMTINGTVGKTAFSLLLVVLAASLTWSQTPNPLIMIGGGIGGFIVAMVTIFKKQWSPVTTPLYAVLEGLFLGGISSMYEVRFPGIVLNAVVLTLGTLGALLIAYRSGVIKATENFKLGVVAATGGIAVVYLVTMVLGMFGVGVPYIHESGTIGIAFSLFVVVIAALNLVLDFDFIESGAAARAPKYMEWYGAFGLMVTLVWLYLEMLRLLSKLQGRN